MIQWNNVTWGGYDMKKIIGSVFSLMLVILIAISSISGVAADNAIQEQETVNVRFTIPTSIAKKRRIIHSQFEKKVCKIGCSMACMRQVMVYK